MGVAMRARLFVRGTIKAVAPPVVAVLLLLVPAASAALVSSVSPEGVLTVQSDASDAIVVTCSDGNVKVNGANPDTGSTACSAITTIRATGGDGPNIIDLSGVTRAAFPSLQTDGPLRVSVAGNAGADTITGSEWNDDLAGGLGDDTLIGGEGDDSLGAVAGNDQIEGGSGVDRLVFFGTDGDDSITAPDGTGQVSTVQETDAYSSIEVFSLRGLGGNDTITSGSGGDTIRGGDGNDVLNGGGGDDFVFGDAGVGSPAASAPGNDVLNGGTGVDLIWGEAANDEITSRDDSADTVNCGSDTDSAVADALDVIDECETVDRGTPPTPAPPPPPPPPGPSPQPVPPPQPSPPLPPTRLKCVVPNVRGNTLSAAKAALQNRRCSAGKISRAFSLKAKRGKVLAQRPRAGTRLAVGGKVQLTVSRGRRP